MNDARVQALWDKLAIGEALARYCRGVDRADREALESVFWPDGTDDHIGYVGGIPGMIDFILGAVTRMRTHHLLGNVLIELTGPDSATSESYVHAYHETEGVFGTEEMLFCARYLDIHERRGDEWRIKHRKVVMDYYSTAAATLNWTSGRYRAGSSRGEKKPDDPLYRFLAGVGA